MKIIITDREKVIASSGLNINIIGNLISNEYLEMIEEREIKIKENISFKLGEYTLEGNFVFIPIISLNDSIGLIILYSDTNLKDELTVGKLIANIFSHKLDI